MEKFSDRLVNWTFKRTPNLTTDFCILMCTEYWLNNVFGHSMCAQHLNIRFVLSWTLMFNINIIIQYMRIFNSLKRTFSNERPHSHFVQHRFKYLIIKQSSFFFLNVFTNRTFRNAKQDVQCNSLPKYEEIPRHVWSDAGSQTVARRRISLEYATDNGHHKEVSFNWFAWKCEDLRYSRFKLVWHNYIIIIVQKNLNFAKCRMLAKKLCKYACRKSITNTECSSSRTSCIRNSFFIIYVKKNGYNIFLRFFSRERVSSSAIYK